MADDQHNHGDAVAQEASQDMIKKLDSMFASSGENSRSKPTLKRNRNVPGLAGDTTVPVIMPSPLTMSATATLHTHLAVNMFRGRKGDRAKNQRPIVGLSLFGRSCGLIWSAARNDDPYADQCLLRIETVYNTEKALLDKREAVLNNMLQGIDGLEVFQFVSAKPMEIPINFHSPWAFRGLQLLLQYDRIVRLAMTASHVGLDQSDDSAIALDLIDDADWDKVVSDSGRAIRHLFEQVNCWFQTGVTREDVRQKNKVAQRAFAHHNEKKFNRLVLEDAVLSGETRASLAPRSVLLEQYIASMQHKAQEKTVEKKAVQSIKK